MSNFKTKIGKALERTRNPVREHRIPRRVERDLIGQIRVYDRTKDGVKYDSDLDEKECHDDRN